MSVKDMSFVKTGDAASFMPEPGMKRQVLAHSDQLMLVRHYFEEGWVGARHSHPHHQLVYVVSGAIRVDVDGRVFDVRAGDSFVVDGGWSTRLRRWRRRRCWMCLRRFGRTIGSW